MMKNKPDQIIGLVRNHNTNSVVHPEVILGQGVNSKLYFLLQGSPVLHEGDVVVLEKTELVVCWQLGHLDTVDNSSAALTHLWRVVTDDEEQT